MTLLEITAKIVLAIALGGLIGLERETSQKPAGFRTNILICLGAASMMILSDLMFQDGQIPNGERLRIAAGVITGVGFIGAGTILQARGSVYGLTTAATIWSVAGLGLIIGVGHYLVAIIVTGAIISTLVIFRKVEDLFLKKTAYRYQIKTKEPSTLLIDLKKLAFHEGIRISDIARKKDEEFTCIHLAFQTTEDKEQKFTLGLLNMESVVEIKFD